MTARGPVTSTKELFACTMVRQLKTRPRDEQEPKQNRQYCNRQQHLGRSYDAASKGFVGRLQLHEVVSVGQSRPIIVSRLLLGNRSQDPLAIDFDLLYDADAVQGTIRIPWFENGNQNSDSKPDSKEGKLLI